MILSALRSAALASALAVLAMPAAADIVFSLTNETENDIVFFYASPSSSEEWGDDILGDQILEAGGSGTVTIASDECEFDIKAVFDDEEEVTDSVNLCETTEYTFTAE